MSDVEKLVQAYSLEISSHAGTSPCAFPPQSEGAGVEHPAQPNVVGMNKALALIKTSVRR